MIVNGCFTFTSMTNLSPKLSFLAAILGGTFLANMMGFNIDSYEKMAFLLSIVISRICITACCQQSARIMPSTSHQHKSVTRM